MNSVAFSAGERIHHSRVSSCRPHQTSSGGLGQETGTVCRDSGEQVSTQIQEHGKAHYSGASVCVLLRPHQANYLTRLGMRVIPVERALYKIPGTQSSQLSCCLVLFYVLFRRSKTCSYTK